MRNHQTLRLAVTVSVMLSVVAPGVQAAGSLQYLSLDQEQRAGGLWFEFEDRDDRDWLTRFTEPDRQPLRSSLSMQQSFSDHRTVHWGVANAAEQTMQTLGFSQSGVTLTGFRGEGDTVSTVFHPFNAAGSYQFHGGLSHEYDYSGVQLDYAVAPEHRLGITRARIQSAGRNERVAVALGYSGRSLSLSLTRVEEAGQYAGRAIDFGLTVGRVDASVQYLRADNDASYSALNLDTITRRGHDLGLTLEQRVNPLFDDANEYRVTVRYGFRFGTSPVMRADGDAATGDDPEARKRKSRNTSILAGAGAVGAAVALSGGGGNGGGDDRARFSNQNDAARDVLNMINPESVKQNREYGGYVYRNGDGSFSSTRPIRGETASVLLPNPASAAPGGSVTTASYHTHAGFDPRFDSENFSSQDLFSDFVFNIDGYLSTPRGQFKYHQVSTGRVITLGGPGTINNAGQ